MAPASVAVSPKTREDVAREALLQIDPLTEFLYTPKTLTALAAGVAPLPKSETFGASP